MKLDLKNLTLEKLLGIVRGDSVSSETVRDMAMQEILRRENKSLEGQNRNSREEIKRDIDFLSEIQGRLAAYKLDVTQREYVDQMIKDWLSELKKLIKIKKGKLICESV